MKHSLAHRATSILDIELPRPEPAGREVAVRAVSVTAFSKPSPFGGAWRRRDAESGMSDDFERIR